MQVAIGEGSLRMKMLLSLLLLGSYGVGVDAIRRHTRVVSLDLFVQESFIKYRQDGTIADNTTEECGACGENVHEGGCTVALRYFVEGECEDLSSGLYGIFATVDNATSAAAAASTTTDLDSFVCLQTFQDENCTVPTDGSAPSASACPELFSLDTCSVSPSQGPRGFNRVVRRLEDWCIPSDEPTGDYQVPLVRQEAYTDRFGTATQQDVKEACEAKNTTLRAFYSSFPGSGEECFYEPVDVEQSGDDAPAIVQGSGQNYCNEEDGTHTIRLFANTNCSSDEGINNGTGPQPIIPELNLTSYPECSNPLEPYGFRDARTYRTSNCRTPDFYCKPVTGGSQYVSDLKSADVTSQPSSSPTESPTAKDSGETPTRQDDGETGTPTMMAASASDPSYLWASLLLSGVVSLTLVVPV